MYGLPQDINLTFFNGKTLLQACFGAHDLILNFTGDVSVTVTSSLRCMDSGGSIQKYDDLRQAAPAVMVLLNQTILSASGNEAGTLTLKFDGGYVLDIYDDSKEYESYTIENAGQIIVV